MGVAAYPESTVSLTDGNGTTNATWRINNKNTSHSWINVSWTGTRPDRAHLVSADRTMRAIAFAVTNASETNDTILVGNGVYSGNLVVDVAGVSVQGAGESVTLQGARDGASVVTVTRSNVAIENVFITSTAFSPRSNFGILVRDADNVTISNARIEDDDIVDGVGFHGSDNGTLTDTVVASVAGAGIYLEDASHGVVTHNVVDGAFNSGVSVSNSDHNYIHRNRISNNNYDGIGLDGLDTTHNRVVENRVINNDGEGISIIMGAANNTVRGNDISGNKHGVQDGAKNNTFIRNQIHDNRRNGAVLEYQTRRTSLIDNTIRENGRHGIVVNAWKDNSLAGNTVVNNSGVGILLKDGETTDITNNQIVANGRGIEIAGGTLDRLRGNTLDSNAVQVLGRVDVTLDSVLDENTFDRAVTVRDDGIAVETIFTEIGDGIAAAEAGETVRVQPGTYPEQIVVERDVTLLASRGVTLDGSTLGAPSGNRTAAITIPETSVATPVIDGFTITGYDVGVSAHNASSAWTLRNSTIRDSATVGVDAAYATGAWTVHTTRFANNSRDALNATKANPRGNATQNWWGAPDGPSGDFNGSGDAVVGNVTVHPFYVDPGLTRLSSADSSVTIAGQLFEAHNDPAANDLLVWEGLDGGRNTANLTTDDGAFAVDLRKNGTYDVRYYQFDPTTDADTDYPKDGSVDLLAVGRHTATEDRTGARPTLPIGHDLTVTVVDQSGTAIEDATVHVVHHREVPGDEAVHAHVEAVTNASGDLVDPESDGPGFEVNGTVHISVEPPHGGLSENGTTVEVSRNRHVTVVLKRTANISGRIEYADATPTTGWRVYVQGIEGTDSDPDAQTNTTGAFRTAVTQNGIYSVEFAQQNDSRDVAFPKDGYPDLQVIRRLQMGSEDVGLGTTTLRNAHLVNVTVETADGTPVTAGRVTIGQVDRSRDIGVYEPAVLTGDGEVRMENADAPGVEINGTLYVEVHPTNDELTTARTEFDINSRRTVTVVVPEVVTVGGRINETDGTPAANDRLEWEGREGTDDHAAVITDDRGRFSGVRLQKNGTYDVAYYQDDPRTDADVAFPKDGSVDVDVDRVTVTDDLVVSGQVNAGHNLTVTVVDTTGAPVEGATVHVASHEDVPGSEDDAHARIAAETNASGDLVHPESDGPGFEVNGTVHVVAEPPSGRSLAENGTTLDISQDRHLTIALGNARTVTGEVVYANGTPPTGYSISLWGTSSGDTVQVGTNGNFDLTVASHRSYRFGFEQTDWDGPKIDFPKDRVPDIHAFNTVSVGATPVSLGTARLPRAHLLNVTVRNESGVAIEGVPVDIEHRNNNTSAWIHGETTANGRLVLHGARTMGVEANGTLRLHLEPEEAGLPYEDATRRAEMNRSRDVTVTLEERETTEPVVVGVEPLETTTFPGDNFTVRIVMDTQDRGVFGAQASLRFDTTVLNATSVERGGFLSSDGTNTTVFARTIDNRSGIIDYGEARRGTDVTDISGHGPLFSVTFHVDANASTNVTRPINLHNVIVSDGDSTRLASTTSNGTAEIRSNRPPSVDATLTTSVNNAGSPFTILGNASDPDGHVENITLRAPDGTLIDEQACGARACKRPLTGTPPRSTWNGSGYTAVALTVTAEDELGSEGTDSVSVQVFVSGDATGDGVVDIFDAVTIGQAWNTKVNDSGYSNAADLNNDGEVDIFDAVIVGQNWQEGPRASRS